LKYNHLGRTNLEISEISLGTEHLRRQPKEVVKQVIKEAVEAGINYFDILLNNQEYLENLREAIEPYREKVHLAVHIRVGEEQGQYRKFSDVEKCREAYKLMLERLGLEKVDVAIIQFVDNEDEYQEVIKPGGVMDYAVELKEKGIAENIGMSTHSYRVAQKAAKTGKIDVIMIWVNFINHGIAEKEEALKVCMEEKVGVLAMKPFAGGNLLVMEEEKQIHDEGKGILKKLGIEITPVHCHSYVLSQPGVTASLFGVKNSEELQESLKYLEATEEEKDFGEVLKTFGKELKKELEGECQLCNHCLPCEVGIDIAGVFYLLKKAKMGKKEEAQKEYQGLEKKAGDCIACGNCLERCPFSVEIIEKMEETAGMFE
jgi:hypothetical protein